ncbi:MAG: Ppx/GppA family phosphatase [Parascardovia denticolens]
MAVTVVGIDCGTNSIRLMVATVSEKGMEAIVPRVMRVVRLGQDVDKTHEFSPEALARTFAAIDEFARILEPYQVDGIRFVATSATRDARNRREFEDYVQKKLMVRPDVIPGTEEARLSFLGTTSVIDSALHKLPYLVMDLGGGSTELVLGGDGVASPDHQVRQAYSMDMGSVRVSERHLVSDPPRQEEIQAATEDVDQAIDEACKQVDFSATGTFIGVSGTATTMASVAIGLTSYDHDAIDGQVISFDRMEEADDEVLRMTRDQRGRLGVIHPGRLDVIGGGALVLTEIMKRIRKDTAAAGHEVDQVMVSEHGLVEGIVRDLGLRLLQAQG